MVGVAKLVHSVRDAAMANHDRTRLEQQQPQHAGCMLPNTALLQNEGVLPRPMIH